MARTPADFFSGLSAAYTDAIRATDFKANIVMFFLSIVMGPVIGARDKYPSFLTLPVLVAPFLVTFFCLFLALAPRYPLRGRAGFPVSRTADPNDFQFVDNPDNDVRTLQLRCAVLSDILFWKTTYVRIAFFVCLASVLVSTGLVLYFAR